MTNGPMNPDVPGATSWSGNVRSLVLRAWLEPGVPPPHLRVRVVEISPSRGERSMAVTTSVDEVCQAVRNWLEALQARGSNENGDGTVTQRRCNSVMTAT
jgi:hypothetical protein